MTLICLISGQLMPNLFSVILLKPKEVVLVHTEDSKNEALFFSDFIKKQKYSVEKTQLVEVEPFNQIAIGLSANKLLTELVNSNQDIENCTLNYTAGTKPMSIGFVNVFKDAGVKLLYIDTQEEICWWTRGTKIEQEPLKVKLNVPELFSLARGAILGQEQESNIQTLMGLTNYFFEKRKDKKFWTTEMGKWVANCVRLQQELSSRNRSEKLSTWKNEYKDESFSVDVDITKQTHMNVSYNGLEYPFKRKEFWLNYFTGGWFEHYVYTVLKNTNAYDDIRCNIRLKTNDEDDPQLKNEIDVVAVKNGIPVFFECKTGMVDQNSITKLKTVSEIYGGRYCEAVLVSFNEITAPAIIEKMHDYGIQLISEATEIEKKLDSIHEFMAVKK